MDYLTLKRHISELSDSLKCKPIVIRTYDGPGRSIFFRLKTPSGVQDLSICLDSPSQGLRLADRCTDINKNSLIVRSLNRLVINSRLASIELAGNEKEGQFDRVVRLHFVLVDEYFGNRSDYYVFSEFTGRISDAFLCDSELKILDRMSRTSNNLVGEKYRLPDSCNLLNPFCEADEKLLQAFSAPKEEWVDKIGAISPLVIKDIFIRNTDCDDIKENRLKRFKEILNEFLNSGITYLYKDGIKVFAVSAFELKHNSNLEKISFKSVNDAMNYIEDVLNGPKRLEQEKKRIVSLLNRDLKQKKILLEDQKKLKIKYEGSEKYQNLGDLITANLYRIKPGSKQIEVEDWNTGSSVVIELDPTKTPAANAKKYYNLYKKSKRGIIEVEKRIESLISDIKWFEEQIWLAENAETESWLQVEENTKTERLARKKEQKSSNKNTKKIKTIIKPEVERENCKYYIGHNAKQNDQITFQVGKKGDIWFHANDVPGAHVVLKKIDGDITEEDIVFGAQLAALNSFAKNSSKVAVDYTEVTNVKRIPDGGLGHVNYTHQRTVVVNLNNKN